MYTINLSVISLCERIFTLKTKCESGSVVEYVIVDREVAGTKRISANTSFVIFVITDTEKLCSISN